MTEMENPSVSITVHADNLDITIGEVAYTVPAYTPVDLFDTGRLAFAHSTAHYSDNVAVSIALQDDAMAALTFPLDDSGHLIMRFPPGYIIEMGNDLTEAISTWTWRRMDGRDNEEHVPVCSIVRGGERHETPLAHEALEEFVPSAIYQT